MFKWKVIKMKKLLLLFCVLSITIGCLGAEETKEEPSLFTLVSQEKIIFKVEKRTLEALELQLPLEMASYEDSSEEIPFPDVKSRTLSFILSLKEHVQCDGTLDEESINIKIAQLPQDKKLDILAELTMAAEYLSSTPLVRIFVEQFIANLHTFDGNFDDKPNFKRLISIKTTNRLLNFLRISLNEALFPYLATEQSTRDDYLCTPINYNSLRTNRACRSLLSLGTIEIYNTKTNAHLKTLVGHTETVSYICWNPESTSIASGSYDKTIRIWNPDTGKCLRTLEGHKSTIAYIHWSPDGSKLASASYDKTIKIWNPVTGSCIKTIEVQNYGANRFCWNTNSTQFACIPELTTIQIWDLKNNACLQTLEGHTDNVTSISFNTKGTQLASGSWDDTVRIWDTKTGTCLKAIETHMAGVSNVLWNESGTQIVSASTGIAKIWNPKTGTCLKLLSSNIDRIHILLFNRLGTQLYVSTRDRKNIIWEIPELTILQQLIVLKIIQNDRPISTETVDRIRETYGTLPKSVKKNGTFRSMIETKAPELLTFGEKAFRVIKHPAFWVPVSIAAGFFTTTLFTK